MMGIVLLALLAPFEFTPVPRWAEDPETEVICVAVRAECPALAARESIEVEVGYDEIYDAKGELSGMRLTKSTGCAPIDEHLLLSQRRFRTMFHKPGQSDLDGIFLEVRKGVDPAMVRIVKASGTNFSLGCN